MAKVSSIMAVGGVGDPIKKLDKKAAAESADKTDKIYRTKKIALVQGGVKDGKTGKASSYVYEKLPTEAGFDVKKHRETVYNENLGDLRRTAEYQNYRRGQIKK